MICRHFPTIELSDFTQRLRRRIGSRRFPLSGALELTTRCNLNCAHCYINEPADDSAALRKELSKDQIRNILDQIVAEGCLWLLLTGGEPLLRQDFNDIYRYSISKGLIVTLFTNGTHIDRNIADFLTDWRPFSIEITLYGLTEKTYETVTRVPGSHNLCFKAIDLLLERGLPLILKSTITSLNKHELSDMKSFADDRGLQFRFDPVIIPRLDHNPNQQFRLSPEEIVSLDEADEERLTAWLDFYDRYKGVSSDPNRDFQCGAGINGFHIDSQGRMSPCLMARAHSYDLQTGNFHEGWHTFLNRVINRKAQENCSCQDCNLVILCENCPAWDELSGKENGQTIDYLCRIAQLRFNLINSHMETIGVEHE